MFVAFTLALTSIVPATATLLVWGALTYANAAPMQVRVIDTAPEARTSWPR